MGTLEGIPQHFWVWTHVVKRFVGNASQQFEGICHALGLVAESTTDTTCGVVVLTVGIRITHVAVVWATIQSHRI